MRCLLLTAALIPSMLGTYQMACESYQYPAAPEDQIKCLATMVYGEARGEATAGKVAVAYTALNRAAKKTVCSVVLAPKQYSIFNDNPALRAAAMSLHIEPEQKNVIDQASWIESIAVARAVLHRAVPDPTGGATHYLADRLMRIKGYRYPRWSKQYIQVASIDRHRFFKPHYPGRK